MLTPSSFKGPPAQAPLPDGTSGLSSSAAKAIADCARCHFDAFLVMVVLPGLQEEPLVISRGASPSSIPAASRLRQPLAAHGEVLAIEDATRDRRLQDDPAVTGSPRIRFVADVSLKSSRGAASGYLRVLGTKPRAARRADIVMLRRLASLAAGLIDGEIEARRARAAVREAERTRLLNEAQGRELDLREARFKLTEKIAHVGAWELDLSTNVVTWSDEIYRICGLPVGVPVTLDLATAVYPEHERLRLEALIAKALKEHSGYDGEFEIVTGSGITKWVRSASSVELVDGRPARLCGIFQDISERHRTERALWKAANEDSLTGLANRAYFSQILDEIFNGEDGRPASAGLLMIDVDHLKEVNDTLGHAAGDELIRTVARRLSATVAEAGTVARVGGDEFVVTLKEGATSERLLEIGGSIIGAMRAKIVTADYAITPQVSIGAAVADASDSGETLRQKADLALYEAKARCRGNCVSFNEPMRAAIVQRIGIIRSVEEALSQRRVVPHYQPIVRLDTAEIVGLEALARIETEDGRILAAGEFRDAFREHQLAHRLTEQMLTRIAADLRQWIDAGFPFQHVGINVTTADFHAGDLHARIVRAFGAVEVPLQHVILEVTETVFMDDPDHAVANAVRRLRAEGLRVALDDFGTGHASLTHLRNFPVDIMKIDKSFVQSMLVDTTSQAIVEVLLDLTQKMDIRVVAEGIETYQQAERLRQLGCRLGQGFLFARPASAAITRDLLMAFGQKPQQLALRRRESAA